MLMWKFDDDKLEAMLLLMFLIGLNSGLLIINVVSMNWAEVIMNILAILILILPVMKIAFED